MALSKPKTKESEVSVEIDLESLLGASARNEAVREVFFQLALDKMQERLDSGLDLYGRPMPKYSDEYKNSLAFKVFGKTDTVNMTLTGDMLGSLSILNNDPKKFKIGFSSDESVKAFAHITGYEGHPVLDGKVPKRFFFGWTDSELKAIAKELKPQLDSGNGAGVNDATALSLIDRLSRNG